MLCFFLTVLQEKNSKPAGASPKAENRLFTQFHAQYPLRERTGLDRLLTISFLSLLRFIITFCPGIVQSDTWGLLTNIVPGYIAVKVCTQNVFLDLWQRLSFRIVFWCIIKPSTTRIVDVLTLGTSKFRFMFATVAFGVGLDLKDIITEHAWTTSYPSRLLRSELDTIYYHWKTFLLEKQLYN